MANSPNIVLSGLAHVPVPVVINPPKKEMAEKAKKERREAKRIIMRDRKRMWDRHFQDATVRMKAHIDRVNALCDTYSCQCRPGVEGRTGRRFISPGTAVRVPVPDSWGQTEVVAVVVDAGNGVFYVPRPTHTFRRKVSAGETVEQFQHRLTTALNSARRMGFSFIDNACHCQGCMAYRSGSWAHILSGAQEPKTFADSAIRTWDAQNNPFADNYLYRERPAAAREDEDGNPIIRRRSERRWPGAGIGGETFFDPKAKGGAARLVGLEVEHNRDVEGTHVWATRWTGAQVISDGSCGREAVTPPIAGENIRKCLTELCQVLNKENAGCDARCGLHVHVDARDMRWADMLRFLTVYCRIESLLFLIGGQNRYSKPSAGHTYCLPVAELYGRALRSADPKGAILAAACLGDRTPEQGRSMMKDNPPGKKGAGRYKSINILPWIAGRAYDRKDTTVEFRLHRGSHNAERIIAWAHICQDVVDWCIKATNADVDNLPKSAARALCIMSPRNKSWIIKRILGWRAATTAGKAPIEDDVGNYKPRRIVRLANGLYTVDPNRISYKSG